MALSIIPFEDYYIQEKCLLTCVSYEDRSKLILQKILVTKKITSCILIKLSDLFEDKKPKTTLSSKNDDDLVKEAWINNYKEIVDLLTRNNVKMIEIEGSSNDTFSLAKKISEQLSPDEKILFDISSFPKYLLLEILRWCENNKFICIYARPGIERKAETEFSIGTKVIGVLKGFEGSIRFDRVTIMVLILGFEGARALTLFKHFEPVKVFAFLGNSLTFFPTKTNEFYINNAKRNNSQLLSNQRVIADEISALDPYSVKEKLEHTISNYSNKTDANIIISCLGTKPQTLGLYLYWLQNKQIQIIYSTPSKRRISSEGLGPIWVYKMKEFLHE